MHATFHRGLLIWIYVGPNARASSPGTAKHDDAQFPRHMYSAVPSEDSTVHIGPGIQLNGRGSGSGRMASDVAAMPLLEAGARPSLSLESALPQNTYQRDYRVVPTALLSLLIYSY